MAAKLTPREKQIVSCLWEAKSNLEIAAECGISIETVKRHISNICDKIGASSRLEVALKTLKRDYIQAFRCELCGTLVAIEKGVVPGFATFRTAASEGRGAKNVCPGCMAEFERRCAAVLKDLQVRE